MKKILLGIFFVQIMLVMQAYPSSITRGIRAWWYNTDLQKALQDQDLIKIKESILNGADVNFVYKKWGSVENALTVTMRRQDIDMLQFLLGRGANIEAECGSEDSALFFAIRGPFSYFPKHKQMIKILLEHGAVVKRQSRYNHSTPLWDFVNLFYYDEVLSQEHIEVLRLMLQRQPSVELNKAIGYLQYALSHAQTLAADQGRYVREKYIRPLSKLASDQIMC